MSMRWKQSMKLCMILYCAALLNIGCGKDEGPSEEVPVTTALESSDINVTPEEGIPVVQDIGLEDLMYMNESEIKDLFGEPIITPVDGAGTCWMYQFTDSQGEKEEIMSFLWGDDMDMIGTTGTLVTLYDIHADMPDEERAQIMLEQGYQSIEIDGGNQSAFFRLAPEEQYEFTIVMDRFGEDQFSISLQRSINPEWNPETLPDAEEEMVAESEGTEETEELVSTEAVISESVNLDTVYANVFGPGKEIERVYADLTHDGTDELLSISLTDQNGAEESYLTIYTITDGSPKQIWQFSVTDDRAAGQRTVYLYHENGKDYLYHYADQLNQSVVWLYYHIFSLTENGAEQSTHEYNEYFPMDSADTKRQQFDKNVGTFSNKRILISPDTYRNYDSDSTTVSNSSEPTKPQNSDIKSTLPDGTYDIVFTGEFQEVSGGVIAVVNRSGYIDIPAELPKPGDVIPLSQYGYKDILVETVDFIDEATVIFNYETDDSGYSWYYMEDRYRYCNEQGAFLTYNAPGGKVFIPNGCKISDWSNASEIVRNDIREVHELALNNGGKVTIADGNVTYVEIYYRP